MQAEVLDVFLGDAAMVDPETRVSLSTDPKDPTVMEKIDFIQKRLGHVFFEVEETPDDGDGKYHWLLMGFNVNKKEVKYVTNWLPNGMEPRKAIYAVEVPGGMMKVGKTLSLQLKTAPSEIYWRRGEPREYTEESPVYYLKLTDEQGAYA